MDTPPLSLLRATTENDASFLFAVYASTRAEEMARWNWSAAQIDAFLKMQFAAQQRAHHTAFPRADRSMIVLHAEMAAGIWVVNRTAEEIRLVDIALLPEHRGKGIGVRLIGALLEEAGAHGVPVRLSVAKSNRAARLYTRLGFAPTTDDGVYMGLEWSRAATG